MVKAAITPAIISCVHKIAEQEDMPTGLKIMSQYGHVLYDATWIAGVGYDEELFEDDDYENDSDMSDKNSDEDSDDDDLGEEFDEMDPDEIAGLVQELIGQIEEPNENNVSNVNSVVNITADSNNSENGAEGNESENNDNQSVGGIEEEQDEEKEDDDNEGNKPEPNEEQPTLSRSQRTTKMPERSVSGDYQMHLHAQSVKPTFYDVDDAAVMGKIMCMISGMFEGSPKTKKLMHLVQTYSLKAGLKKFGDHGHGTAISEMKQLHDCAVFQPFMVEDLTPVE